LDVLKIAKNGIRRSAILGRIDQCSHREADQLRPTLRLPGLLRLCRRSGRGVQRNLLPALRRSPPYQWQGSSSLNRSPISRGARSADKPSGPGAGGEQCSASAPGAHTFGYVIEGTYEFAINGEPSRTLKAGDTFYEPPTTIFTQHRETQASTSVQKF
jgi:hypothetical protein